MVPWYCFASMTTFSWGLTSIFKGLALRNDMTAKGIAFWYMLMGAFFGLLYGGPANIARVTKKGWLYASCGGMLSLVGHVAFLKALDGADVSVVALFIGMEPVVTYLAELSLQMAKAKVKATKFIGIAFYIIATYVFAL